MTFFLAKKILLGILPSPSKPLHTHPSVSHKEKTSYANGEAFLKITSKRHNPTKKLGFKNMIIKCFSLKNLPIHQQGCGITMDDASKLYIKREKI